MDWIAAGCDHRHMSPEETVAGRESDRGNVIDLGASRGEPHQAHGPTGLLARAVRALSAWLLRVESAWEAVRLPKLALPAPRSAAVTVGRDPGCALVLGTDPTVSRRHADLCWIAGHWVVADLHSSNGTWVNGARIVSPTVVRDGDELAFGRTRFVLTSDTRVTRIVKGATAAQPTPGHAPGPLRTAS